MDLPQLTHFYPNRPKDQALAKFAAGYATLGGSPDYMRSSLAATILLNPPEAVDNSAPSLRTVKSEPFEPARWPQQYGGELGL